MVYSFSRMVPILFGPGASRSTGEKVKELGITKALVVCDKGVKDAGIVDKVVENIKAAGVDVIIYDGVLADPPDFIIHEAAELGLKEKVDGVVGLGGGSPMDAAKAVNVMLVSPPPITDYYGDPRKVKPGKPLVLIPTTAGTGSEVTQVSVVSNSRTGKKAGVLGPATTGNLAIVDPELLLALPPHITAATGMDALSHAVECMTSGMANPLSDDLGARAVELIFKYLPVSVKDGGDLNARTQMAYASMIAGVAFNDALPHWGHAIAHALGSQYHIPHGVGCAVALPAALEYVADKVPDKLPRIAKAMGLVLAEGLSCDEIAKAIGDAVRNLNREIGVPSIKEYKVKKEDLTGLCKGVLADDCANFGPKGADEEQVLKMLDKTYVY